MKKFTPGDWRLEISEKTEPLIYIDWEGYKHPIASVYNEDDARFLLMAPKFYVGAKKALECLGKRVSTARLYSTILFLQRMIAEADGQEDYLGKKEKLTK